MIKKEKEKKQKDEKKRLTIQNFVSFPLEK